MEKHRKKTNRGQVLRALRGHSRTRVAHSSKYPIFPSSTRPLAAPFRMKIRQIREAPDSLAEMLAGDAVLIASSPRKIPANREFYREFCGFGSVVSPGRAGGLGIGPLEAAVRVADATLDFVGHLKVADQRHKFICSKRLSSCSWF